MSALPWYDASFYPDSAAGYCYIIRLLRPYLAGVKMVREGGIVVTDFSGKRRYVGGWLTMRPVVVHVYVGWTPAPWQRYDQHMNGQGSRLLAHLSAIGWPMRLEVVTPGGRDLEARLKRLHNGAAILRAISPTYMEG